MKNIQHILNIKEKNTLLKSIKKIMFKNKINKKYINSKNNKPNFKYKEKK